MGGFGADGFPLQQVLIGPDVYYLVKHPNVSMPESGQGRILPSMREGIGKALLELAYGAGFQGVGANFVDHGLFLQVRLLVTEEL